MTYVDSETVCLRLFIKGYEPLLSVNSLLLIFLVHCS